MAVLEKKKGINEQNVDDIRKYRETGDEDLKNDFFVRNDRLCWHVAGKFQNTGMSMDELLSAARFSMLKAFNTFNLDAGIQFATYATRCMGNEILMEIRRRKKHRGQLSIDEPLNVDSEGNELTLASTLGDMRDFDEFHVKQEAAVAMEAVNTVLKERERFIFLRKLEGRTQPEIAEELGISQSYISRIMKKTQKKLRNALRKQEIIETAEKAKETRTMDKKELVKPKATKVNRRELSAKRKSGFVWMKIYHPKASAEELMQELKISLATVITYEKKFKNGELNDVVPMCPEELNLVHVNEKWEVIPSRIEQEVIVVDEEAEVAREASTELKGAVEEAVKPDIERAAEADPRLFVVKDEGNTTETMSTEFRKKWSDVSSMGATIIPPPKVERVAPPVMDIDMSGVNKETIEALLKAVRLDGEKRFKLKLVIEEVPGE